MFKDLNRCYKERDPNVTINKVKGILAEARLKAKISDRMNPMPHVYSHRVEIQYGKEGVFGTNGKGRTEDYSLASAYAELLERIQNGFMTDFGKEFLTKLKNEHGFYYYPDEVFLSKEEFQALPEKVLLDCTKYGESAQRLYTDDYFKRLEECGLPGVVAVPYYDTLNKKTINIPLNLIIAGAGSNGMAAGNTIPEAVYQGIAELMERWCASQVYFGQLTPPTIPNEFLRQFEKEYKILQNIESMGFDVIVKDFSAGLRMPSLGLLLIDRERGKYRLNVGTDSNFAVALSRVITEIYQGDSDLKRSLERCLEIPIEEHTYFADESPDSQWKRRIEFSSFTRDGSGKFPKSLFGDKESYVFDPAVWTSAESYPKEVEKYINLFHEQGFNVYTRDVSFLGFPSVFIYIPEVSFMGKKTIFVDNAKTVFPSIELDRVRQICFNLEMSSRHELLEAAESLEQLKAILFFELLGIHLSQSISFRSSPVTFVLALIYYRIGEFDKALANFKEYRSSEKPSGEYFKLVEKFMEVMCDKDVAESEKVEIFLSICDSNDKVAREVVEDMQHPEHIFKNVQLPRCPDCHICKLKPNCHTTGRYHLASGLYAMMKNGNVVQMSSI